MNQLSAVFAVIISNLRAYALPIVLALAAFLLIFLLKRKIVSALSKIIKKCTSRFSGAADIIDCFRRSAVFFVAVLAIYLGGVLLIRGFGTEFSAAPFLFLTKALKICGIVALTWGLMDAAPPIVEAVQGGKREVDKTLILFFSKILKVVLILLAVVIIIAEVGYNISGLITGLGLGGLTFALAAKDSAANLFGGLVIISDKPFSVDDWIETPDLEGVVTDITLRSTRIRTFKDAEVIVPNASLANMQIINWSRMNKRRISFKLGISYDTPKEKLTEAVSGIRNLIETHATVERDSIVVAFDAFGSYSLDLQVYYFTEKTKWNEYMAVKEAVNFAIMAYLQSIGVTLAYPTQTVICETRPQ